MVTRPECRIVYADHDPLVESTRFFDRLELLEPGVVSCSLWRPDPTDIGTPTQVYQFGGIGRKPTSERRG